LQPIIGEYTTRSQKTEHIYSKINNISIVFRTTVNVMCKKHYVLADAWYYLFGFLNELISITLLVLSADCGSRYQIILRPIIGENTTRSQMTEHIFSKINTIYVVFRTTVNVMYKKHYVSAVDLYYLFGCLNEF